MPAFILLAIGTLSFLGLICGYLMRRHLPTDRWIFALVVLMTVLPWFWHHVALLSFAEDVNTRMADDYARFSTAINLKSGGLIALAVGVVVSTPQRLRIVASGVPILGFVVAWKFSLPRTFEFIQFPFDNIRTIWLFIWTIAATSLLLAFCWPRRQRDIGE